jgi:hypothetical protein
VLSAISLNQNLMKDVKVPDYISPYLRLQKVGLTMWSEFVRKPTFNLKERIICSVMGSEKFRLVSAIFKQNMYSGVFEELDPLESPINLFETDPENVLKYDMMKLDNIFTVDLEQGSCLYVPSYYWYQSQTVRDQDTIGSAESVMI